MKSINKLIQLGYDIRLNDNEEIICNLKDGININKTYISGLINEISVDLESAVKYIKSLITLKIITTPMEYGLYLLSVKAFCYDKSRLPGLDASVKGTLDETGSYLLSHYLENPQFSFIHSMHYGETLYVKLSCWFSIISPKEALYYECPWGNESETNKKKHISTAN